MERISLISIKTRGHAVKPLSTFQVVAVGNYLIIVKHIKVPRIVGLDVETKRMRFLMFSLILKHLPQQEPSSSEGLDGQGVGKPTPAYRK